jgi:hypothetical protein
MVSGLAFEIMPRLPPLEAFSTYTVIVFEFLKNGFW